jgi:hypothetical protein
VIRRAVTGAVVVLALGGAFLGHASADTTQTRHKVCVLGPTPQAPNQEGFCVTWVDLLPTN